jgi:mono/diheme cytochrome c family protein
MKLSIFASLAVLTLAMLACSLGSGGSNKTITTDELQVAFDQLPVGDAARGEQIFLSQPCHTCHVQLAVGPVLTGDPPLATIAETRRSGYSAELYLYESIVEPNAYIVSSFGKDIMPAEFGRNLTDQELADLVAYLMTMK